MDAARFLFYAGLSLPICLGAVAVAWLSDYAVRS